MVARKQNLKGYFMKTFSMLFILFLAVGAFVAGFLATPVFAQDTEQMQELQRVIEVPDRIGKAILDRLGGYDGD
jgi:hypothetical protein